MHLDLSWGDLTEPGPGLGPDLTETCLRLGASKGPYSLDLKLFPMAGPSEYAEYAVHGQYAECAEYQDYAEYVEYAEYAEYGARACLWVCGFWAF